MKPIEFWFEHIGTKLDSSSAPEESTGLSIPHRALKGVKPLRLGAIDVFYIAAKPTSYLIGRIDLPSCEDIQIIGTETVSARKHIASWLINESTTPFMVGVIGNANPNASMSISHTPSRGQFCESGAGFMFNLETIRSALPLIAELNWKSDIAPALHQVAKYREAAGETKDYEKQKLLKLFNRKPELRHTISKLDIRPNSGEYTLLSWLNIERE